MKRALQTLLVLAAATAMCSSAFAAGEKKEERFVLSSAAEPTHRADNTDHSTGHPQSFWNGLGNFDDTPDIEIARLEGRDLDAMRFYGIFEFLPGHSGHNFSPTSGNQDR